MSGRIGVRTPVLDSIPGTPVPRPPGDREDPISPVGGAGGPGELDPAELEGTEGVGGPDAMASAEAAAGADATSGVDGPGGIEAVQDDAGIAQALEAGRISPAQAQQALIEEAIEAQLPDGASPADRELLRAELEAVLAGDPTLERLLDPN